MKITKSTLQRIIKEEHEKLLGEAFYDKSGEYAGRDSMSRPYRGVDTKKPSTQQTKPEGMAEITHKESLALDTLLNAINAKSPNKIYLKKIGAGTHGVYVQVHGEFSLANLVQAAEQRGTDQKLLATAKAILDKQG